MGHEILLSSGDSTSRVLPIEKVKNRFRIQFASDFAFAPEEVAETIKRVVVETNIAKKYLAEVEYCGTNMVAYSFEIDRSQEETPLACRGRIQPKDCYQIWFTILDESAAEEYVMSASVYPKWLAPALFGLILTSLSGLGFLLHRKRKLKAASSQDPDQIKLGAYWFNPRTMELVLNEKKTELSGKEVDLLLLLYNAANTTLEKAHILKMVWGDDGDYIGRTLDVFISKLRKKLELDPDIRIVNIRGVGYKLVLDV